MIKPVQLTPVEQEFMEILWRIGEGTVHDILEHLPGKRDLAYTSVSTILRILQQKQILTIRKEGRKHIYKPKLSKQQFAHHSINKLKNIYEGRSVELVAHLLGKEQLTKEELDKIQTLLDQKKKELV